MNIGEYSVKTPVLSWLLVVILLGGGIWGFQSMGRLEDPAFTVKLAKIITLYPGASAQQVQDEVTYHVEEAIQLMEQVKWIKKSISRPGLSDVTIEFKETSPPMPATWTSGTNTCVSGPPGNRSRYSSSATCS